MKLQEVLDKHHITTDTENLRGYVVFSIRVGADVPVKTSAMCGRDADEYAAQQICTQLYELAARLMQAGHDAQTVSKDS